MPTPAEIMNKTAAKNAQTANYDAAGAVPQTGPLTQNSSLPAGFQQDATGRIFKVGGSTSDPVITSEDVKDEFSSMTSQLDEKIKSQFGTQPQTDGIAGGDTSGGTAAGGATTGGAGDATTTTEQKGPTFNAEAGRYEDGSLPSQKAQADYDAGFSESLASLDATSAATIQGLKQQFDQRIEEQRRINDIRISRTKAYGLGKGTSRYVPQQYSDAVTLREEEAAKAISQLEGQRNSLIAQAEAAARQGRSDLLRQKMQDIDKIEENLRSNLDSLKEESNRQYENLRQLRKEQEQEHEANLEKMRKNLAALAGGYLDDYEGKTDQEQTDLIQKIMAQTGLSYADVYGEMQNALAQRTAEKQKQDKADYERNKGELRTIGNKLYRIKYDKDGNITKELVASGSSGGSGGSGGGGTSEDGSSEDFLNYDSFLKELGTAENRSLDPNAEENRKAYEDYKQQFSMLYGDFQRKTTDSKGKSLSATTQKKEDAKSITNFFDRVRGGDGYVSPEDYAKAKQQWVEYGYTTSDFDSRFKTIYTNPTNLDYTFDK